MYAYSFFTKGALNGPIICPIRLATGYPCPFCGTTRAICALSQGHLRSSLLYNPFGLIVFFAFLFWVLRIKWIEKSLERVLNGFRSLTTARQIAYLSFFYLILWGLDVARIHQVWYIS